MNESISVLVSDVTRIGAFAQSAFAIRAGGSAGSSGGAHSTPGKAPPSLVGRMIKAAKQGDIGTLQANFDEG